MSAPRPRLLFIGAKPPPIHGVSMVNAMLLDSPVLREHFEVHLLDLADRRPISTVERFDWQNVWLALRHAAQCLWWLVLWHPALVYVPISQKTLGFLRDALFLVPARLLGLKVVVHLHGGNLQSFFEQSSWLMKLLIRFCLGRIHAGIVLGNSLVECLRPLAPSARIVVVPNGIPDLRKGLGMESEVPPAGQVRILYLGTVCSEKGVDVFLMAASQLLESHVPCEFVVAGPWWRVEEQRQWESRLQPLIRTGQIQFVGEVNPEQKARLLSSVHLAVLPFRQQEGMPLVVLEAMCAGKPVITTDRGCLSEVVEEGVTGFVVPIGDVHAVAARIRQLVQDQELCRRMGQASRLRYEERYGEAPFLDAMIRVFQEVLSVQRG